jgi:hypothetical protein
MSNGREEFEKDFENTMKSKAALDALRAVKQYSELIKSGWPRDKAFLVAFMGIQVLFIPGVKPLPEPDPPFFSLPALHEVVKKAHSHVSGLKKHIEADLAFLEAFIREQGKK